MHSAIDQRTNLFEFIIEYKIEIQNMSSANDISAILLLVGLWEKPKD